MRRSRDRPWINAWADRLDGMEILENVPLAPYTTFKIGGPARWFAEAASEADILEAVSFARERGLPLFVLGGGSNLLVSDSGFAGLVLHIALRGIREHFDDDTLVLQAEAGEDWDKLVSHAVSLDCAGIECLAGIPGTVGGTPVQNVGAYGQEVSERIVVVRALDLRSGKFVEMSGAECGFAYRQSMFNTSAKGQFIVTRVDYALTAGGPPTLTYADLQRHFQGAGEVAIGGAGRRGGAGDPAGEGDVSGGRRSGLRERGELLQESRGGSRRRWRGSKLRFPKGRKFRSIRRRMARSSWRRRGWSSRPGFRRATETDAQGFRAGTLWRW